MKKVWNIFSKLYEKEVDGRGLAVFRIIFSVILLGEALQLFYFRHLIFDVVPYVEAYEIAIWPIFFFWIPSLIFLIFGFFTRVAAIINYILIVIILGTTSSYEYHMFYSYLIVSFLFIFLPISRNLSLDSILSTENNSIRSKTVSVLSYYVPVLIGIGFVYFDSVFFKVTSPLWMNGLGMWKPASMPQAVFINVSPILNWKYFVLALGYLTLLFETIFVFTFWRRRWRLPLLIIGIGLHIGILVCFPIPFFALGVSSVYLLMVPVKFWKTFFNNKIVKRIADAINSFFRSIFFQLRFTDLFVSGRETVNNFSNTSSRNIIIKRLSFFGLIFFILVQVVVSYNSPLWKLSRKEIGVADNKAVKASEKTIKKMTSLTRDFFGITNHGVFMDNHFDNYNHSIAVIYKSSDGNNIWLPLTNEQGTPGSYLFGPIWIKWTFRGNNPHIDQETLKKTIRDFTAFWAYKQKIALDNAVFNIKVKKNRVPHKWEHDFLNKQLKNPWIDAGTVEWENNEFKADIENIEKI